MQHGCIMLNNFVREVSIAPLLECMRECASADAWTAAGKCGMGLPSINSSGAVLGGGEGG